MPNDIDILMEYVQEINAKPAMEVTDLDGDRLIAYHRHNRARRLAGWKPSRVEKPAIDVLSLLNIAPTNAPKITGTVRRT